MGSLYDFLGRNPELVYLLVSAALISSVALMTWLVKAEADSPARQMKRRVEKLTGGMPHALSHSGTTVSVKRYGADSSFAVLDRFLKNFLPRPALLRSRLAKTGSKLTIGEYAMTCTVTGLAGAGLVLFFLDPGPVVCVFAGITIGVTLPHMTVSLLIKRRIAKFVANFPEAIELIVRGLKSGLPVSESIRTVAEEIPKPVGSEFAQVSSSVKLGRSMEDAMWDTAARIDIPEFKFFVISLSVQKETGGNLAETLENLADILRRRRQMKLKIRALSSEARASAYIIGSLPFIMFGIIYFLNTGYVMELFTDPRGNIMLGVGFISLSLGIFSMWKLVRFEI
jgi:tight adherence protein B